MKSDPETAYTEQLNAKNVEISKTIPPRML